jgi:hypothetical protein
VRRGRARGKYYLDDFVDPALAYDPAKVIFVPWIEVRLYDPRRSNMRKRTLTAESLGEVVIRFNVKKSLAPQLMLAKAELVKWQKQVKKIGGKVLQPRDRSDLYVRYLRMLDALEAGASKNDIVEVFSREADAAKVPDESTIRNWIKAARAMAEKHYYFPLLFSSKKGKRRVRQSQ